MDFEYHYSEEQEAFRKEVREFFDANLPPDWPRPHFHDDFAHVNNETHKWVRDMRVRLGERGWLFPTWPQEYGGGGLSAEHDVVIQEEMAKYRFPHSLGPGALMPAVTLVWGTEEQKQKLARPVIEGKVNLAQLFTEPSAGSDLASVKTQAVKDGDDWVISGEKVFVASHHGYGLGPDQEVPDIREELDGAFMLAVTNPDAPRHRNLGYFVIPFDVPGITFHQLDLLSHMGKQQIYLDNVRVPNERLIGEPGQGWQVSQTGLELEHGGGGNVVPRHYVTEKLLQWAKETGRLQDPHALHAMMDAYIDSEIARLFGQRNYWMHETRQEMSYHGSQLSLWRKESDLRIADAIREVMGLEALLNGTDAQCLWWGEMENFQKESLVRAHPGGTIEVQKVIMARRMGVSRTKERAAVTHATAQKQQ